MADTIWKELRKPFPKEVIGLLPKPYKKDSPKGKCTECGGYHGLPAVHLDYVGHAAVTDRLNTVDPSWTWEPVAFDPQGSPALDRDNNLWIKLTVGGVTRMGVGDGNNMKERIGDAIRNAAMRFGVALDLWSKDELESTLAEPELKNDKPSQATPRAPAKPNALSDTSAKRLSNLMGVKGVTDRQTKIDFLDGLAKGSYGVPTFMSLTEEQATGLEDTISRMSKEAILNTVSKEKQ